MKLETVQRWTTRLLLGFVLVSIGFALGRNQALRQARAAAPVTRPAAAAAATPAPAPAGAALRAYYLHGTFRCATCNRIEQTARRLLETEFAREMASGRIVWRSVNFDQEPELAGRYNVAASTLVLAQEVEGREVAFRRLDEVWSLAETPEPLKAYIRDNVEELLP